MADLFSQVEVWVHVKSLSTPINSLQLRGKDPMPPLELRCSHVCLPVRACTHTHTPTHTLLRSNQARKCPAPSDKTYSLIFFKLWLMISSWLQARTAEILGVQSSALHFMQSTTLLLQFPSKHVRWPEVRDIFAQFSLMWSSHDEDSMCDSLAIYLFFITVSTTNSFFIEHPKEKNSSSTMWKVPFRQHIKCVSQTVGEVLL